MGQIVGLKAKPKRCNLNKLSQLGTPAAGEYILVSYDNSMTANGQGNFDRYIIGDGRTAATALELKYLDDSTRPYIVEEVNKAVADIQPIEITGDVANAPDEEDLTSENQGGTDVLKFKDKAYNSALYSGLGRVYLRKNIVTLEGVGKNVLTQAMVNTANTIYHIQYDYDLNGQTITLPTGCVLEFEGGSVKNGAIAGQNTIIQSLQETNFIGCLLTGNFLGRGQSKWFQGTMEDADIISSVFAFDEAEFDGETFDLSSPVSVSKALSVYGNFVSFNYTGSGFCFTFSNNVKVNNINIESADGGISITSSNAELLGCSITTESLVSEAISCACNKTLIEECNIEGGMRCLYISGSGTAPTAIVKNNTFKSSTKYDNVHLLNLSGGKVYNNISSDSQRSGIVIGRNVENVDVFNNKCTDNKVDSSNQGGWGIVATYLSKKCRIYSNSLLDNQTGGITADLEGGSDESNYDAGHIIHSNYIKNGVDGIRLYKSYKSIVANNVIESTFYGILCSSSQRSIICGNIVFSDSDVDVTNTYGILINGSDEVCVNGNSVTLIGGKRNYCIGVSSSNFVTLSNNKIKLDNGGTAPAIFNLSGTCTNITISTNDVLRTVTSSRYSSFAIITASSSVISHGNIIRGSKNGFQNIYNIKGNNASLIAHGNIIEDVVNRAFIEGTTNTGLTIKINDTFKGTPYSIPSESGTTAKRPASTDIYNGFKYFDTDLGKPIWWDGTGWVEADEENAGILRSGTTAQRPTPRNVGFRYFDEDINKPIFYTGTGWVDATGAPADNGLVVLSISQSDYDALVTKDANTLYVIS